MEIASHVCVPHAPLCIASHITEPILCAGLTEGGAVVSNLKDVRDGVTFDPNCYTTLFLPSSCHAVELQPVTENPYLFASTEADMRVIDIERKQSVHHYEIPELDENVRRANVLKAIEPSILLAGDDSGGMHLFDIRTPFKTKVSASVLEQGDYISSIEKVEAYDTCAILSSSGDGTLCAYDLRTRGRTSEIKLQYATEGRNDDLLSLAILPKSDLIVCGTLSGALNLYNLRFLDSTANADAVAHVDRMHGHPECVNAILPTLHDGVVVTGSSDGIVRVVDVIKKNLLGILDYRNSKMNDEDNININDDRSGLKRARKRKGVARWPVEAVVPIEGLSLPTYALLSNDDKISFCDGAALVDDSTATDNDNDESNKEQNQADAPGTEQDLLETTLPKKPIPKLEVTTEAEFTKRRKTKRKKRRGGEETNQSKTNAFFNELYTEH